MTVDKLKRFVAKRSGVLLAVLAVAVLLFGRQRMLMLCGLAAGGGLSLLRFAGNAWISQRLLAPGLAPRTAVCGSLAAFLIHQEILLIFLWAAYCFNLSFFIGGVAGILLVPAVIMINSVTEAAGITANGFE